MGEHNSRGDAPRRELLKKSAIAFAALSLPRVFIGCGDRKEKRPNLIMLLTDDQRWDTLGCMGNTIVETPNLDRLASRGVIFERNFVTTSICVASRASIFTGQYVRRHGIIDFNEDFRLEALRETYPLLFRQAGYRTGFIGKWGVGNNLPAQAFDYFKGFPGQGQYFQMENGRQRHLTTIMGDQALEFIRSNSPGQPFCLSISFKAPHVQDEDPRRFLYDPEHEALFRDAKIPVPKTADPHYFEILPEFLKNSEARRRWEMEFSTPEKYQESVKGYYRLIYGVDVAAGRIMSLLEESGMAENTIILFTGDNGFYLGEHGLSGKWFMHEESIRTPLIIYDPSLPSSSAGTRRNEMTLNIDAAPTMLEMCGLPIPSGMQGTSLVPLLQGEHPPWRQEFFYEHLFEHNTIPKSEGVRTERWKYIRYVEREPLYEEVYDIESDPLEERNLALEEGNEEILGTLRSRWEELRREAV